MVETYIVPSPNTGEDTLGPTSVTHKSEGLRRILEAETPVRIELALNIFHECLSDIPNDSFPINNLNSQYSIVSYNTCTAAASNNTIVPICSIW